MFSGKYASTTTGVFDIVQQGLSTRSTCLVVLVATTLALVACAFGGPLDEFGDAKAAPDSDCPTIGSSMGRVDKLDQRKLFKELTRRCFRVAREVASISRDVRNKLAGSKQSVPDDVLRSELARQCQVDERLHALMAELLQEYNVSQEDFARLLAVDATAADQHREEVDKMMQEALGGNLPVLPGLDIPAELDQERVLKLYGDTLSLKLEKVRQLASVTKGKCFSTSELGKAATLISHEAEVEVFAKNEALCGQDGVAFHSAMATFARSATFSAKMAKMDVSHRKKIVVAFKSIEQD